MKLTKYILYLVILTLHLLIALFTDNSPNDSLNGFISYIFLGLWFCITISYLSKMKRIREYSASMNNFALVFGGMATGTIYAMWGDYTTILSDSTIPANVNLNLWIIILALPYLMYSLLLLSLCFSKYFHIYLGNKSIGARTFNLLTSILFISVDIVYLLMSQGILSGPIWDLDPETSAINLSILVSTIILFIYFIIGITKRRPVISGISMNRVSNRLNDIDRQIEDADRFASAARREERTQNMQTQARQDRDRKKRQKKQEKEREKARRRKEEERQRQRRQAEKKKRQSKSKTYVQSSSKTRRISTNSPSSSTSSKSASSARKKELLRMRPKAGKLSQDDFKCIFCFEMPSASEGRRGIVLCPNCRYPAHADEFQNWVHTSNLCSRCDGVIPSRFRRHPTIIPVKEYLRAYKFWKKKF